MRKAAFILVLLALFGAAAWGSVAWGSFLEPEVAEAAVPTPPSDTGGGNSYCWGGIAGQWAWFQDGAAGMYGWFRCTYGGAWAPLRGKPGYGYAYPCNWGPVAWLPYNVWYWAGEASYSWC